MGKNTELQKDAQNQFKLEPVMNANKTDVSMKIGKNLKMFIYLISLAGIGLLFNACMSGYVATEPSYVEYDRPPRPNNLSIWIDGDYGWNNRTHGYVQKAGYWGQPRQGSTYVAGNWKTTPKGKTWTKGSWQKQNRQVNTRNKK